MIEHDRDILVCLVHGSQVPLSLCDVTLAGAERARADSFACARERDGFVRTRGVLRRLLARITGTAPKLIEISTAGGKPHLPDTAGLHFNVSRSSDWIVVAAAVTPVGIDIEKVEGHALDDGVAEELFHADELARLSRLSGRSKTAEFFRIWTQKEAFSKAVGPGVSMDFQSFAVPSNGGRIMATVGPAAQRCWYSRIPRTPDGLCLALASPAPEPVVRMIGWPKLVA